MSQQKLQGLFLLYCFCGLSFLGLNAQVSPSCLVPVGEWTTLFSYTDMLSVTQSEEDVYYANKVGILQVHKETHEITRIDKLWGLTKSDIAKIHFDVSTNSLIVVYADADIDIIKNGVVYNYPFVFLEQILGSKAILDVYSAGSRAYFSFGFGLFVLNLDRLESVYTTFTDGAVFSFTQLAGYNYMSTNEGIFRISSDSDNQIDFDAWEQVGPSEGFPAVYNASLLEAFQDQMLVALDNSLYIYEPATLTLDTILPAITNQSIIYINSWENEAIVGLSCYDTGADKDCNGLAYRITADAQTHVYTYDEVARPVDAVIDHGTAYFADIWWQRRVKPEQEPYYSITVDSPFDFSVFDMNIIDNTLYVSAGGYGDRGGPLFNAAGIYTYEDCSWDYMNRSNRIDLDTFGFVYDYMDIVRDPLRENRFYIASFIHGLLEVENDKITALYTDVNTNSAIKPNKDVPQFTQISDLEFDEQGNLWIANNTTDAPLVVRTPDGTWHDFALSGKVTALRIAIDQVGNVWTSHGPAGGLSVFMPGENFTNNQVRIFSEFNSNLPNGDVNDIEVDLNGTVWVGTNQGVVAFDCGQLATDPSVCQGNKPITTLDGFNAYLLVGEQVRVIAVDGANRKWFGTTNGLFVQSESGREQVHYFNVDNSPLPSNIITSILPDPVTGMVYIGTESGLVAYRAEATEGTNFHQLDAYAFPNPVEPTYEGPITITGLARDSHIKIVDVSGRLVHESTALGGQATWDGKDYKGHKAASGVYIVYATSATSFGNPDILVTKILLMN